MTPVASNLDTKTPVARLLGTKRPVASLCSTMTQGLLILLLARFTTARFCSSILPVYSSCRSSPSSPGQLTSHISFPLQQGAQVCLMARPESGPAHLSSVVSLVSVSLVFPTIDSYQFTVPSLAVSCYCQCDFSPCQLASCPLCFQFSSLAPSCPPSPPSPSSTCCSVKLTTPHPALTALRLGEPAVRVRYQVEQFSPLGHSEGTVSGESLGRQGHSVRVPGQGQDILLHFTTSQAPRRPVPGSWVVVDKEGRAVLTPVNTPQGRDPLLPGWLKVERGGRVVAPSDSLIQRSLHLVTESCKEQRFSLTMDGLNLEKEPVGRAVGSYDGSHSVLVTNLSSLVLRTTVMSTGPWEVAVHQNSSSLGTWEAVVVRGVQLSLNISLQNSCGLIFGRLHTARFSVNLPSCSAVSQVSLPLLVVPTMVCLQGEGAVEQCQTARTVREAPPLRKLGGDQGRWVESIPVVWKHSSSASQEFPGTESWAWLQDVLHLSNPVTIAINSVIIIVILIILVKILFCLLPRCNSK